jgi:hypothetical protein
MSYQKQQFIDYPNEGYTTLKAEHLNHIEEGIVNASVHIVDLTNIDRIVAIGDSYTESCYTIKDKAWLSKVSLLTEYNYDNFAIAGDTYYGQLTKIRNGSYEYAKNSNMTWEKLHPTHALLMSKANDTPKYNSPCQPYIYNMAATIETIKGLGAIPIIATEYHVKDQEFTQTAFDYYAKKYGGYFIDLTEKAYVLRGSANGSNAYSDYKQFWSDSHPGTRVNHIFADTVTNYINKNLPRPYSSIKIFRARDNSNINDLDQYLFGNVEERAEKFKEISICHSALNESKYYDNCTQKPYSRIESEYFKLMSELPVEFDKICLIDVILPTTIHDIETVELITNKLNNVDCYVKDVLAAPYPNTGTADKIGHYTKLNQFGLVEGQTLKRAVDCDKITFLLVGNDKFNLTNVQIKFKGDITKTRSVAAYNNTLTTNCENERECLLNATTFDEDNISKWLKYDQTPCQLIPSVPADTILPYGITKMITLTPENEAILQRINVKKPKGTTYNNNYKIKIWARYFPDIFDAETKSYPEESIITDDSFDWAKLNIHLYAFDRDVTNKIFVKMPKLIGLHWTEVELDITLPPAGSNWWWIGLSVEDKPIQLAKCEII